MGLIVLTSSRDASIRMRQFLNELELVIPNAVKVNRGKSSIIEIAGKALSLGADRILYIGSRGGNPGFIRFLRVKEGVIEVMPYLIRIFGVKLLIDMPINVKGRQKARSGVVVSLGEYVEVTDLLSEQLGLPSMRVYDFESVRGMYDVIFLIHRVENAYEVQILNGRDLGPYGPFMKISDVIYVKPRVIRIG
ncbi:Brix domain-containing protein [Vulcanisaeta distributa]|uniref:Probable Brix domain-containing ribosomal biogenesis protein n=1 Tax=Vulcanisaeta distributa (strain DSM 14429 / JCM 11212 / NBRC 100878 / IC-017) TaxID=572478 RepID=E1QPP4_VULDI|nr:Brix domain-containing protein [Vulcanisaeta distributa]ADN50340.1 Brix domain protein [Vulcanisaeta distributa DSM 14429]